MTDTTETTPPLDEILANFELIDDWEERYRYVIELGRTLAPYPEDKRDEAHKVRGCASQVWLDVEESGAGASRALIFHADSDAHIVRGLIALLLAVYSGHTPRDILAADALGLFEKLGLTAHLTPQRSNGVRAMVERIRGAAQAAA